MLIKNCRCEFTNKQQIPKTKTKSPRKWDPWALKILLLDITSKKIKVVKKNLLFNLKNNTTVEIGW